MNLKALEILAKADLPPSQAHAIGEAIEIEVMGHLDHLATKADIESLRVTTKADIERLHADVERLRVDMDQRLATKADVERIRSAIFDRMIALTVSLAGIAVAFAGVILGGIYFMFAHMMR